MAKRGNGRSWREHEGPETLGGEAEQAQQLLASKSRMLEEVDQLMDLVLEEKAAMQEKIAALEVSGAISVYRHVLRVAYKSVFLYR